MFEFLRGGSPEDRFARQVMRHLKGQGWAHPMAYDGLAFAIELGGEGGTLFLKTLFREWRSYSIIERGRAMQRAFAFVFDERPGESFEEVTARLLPLVRNRVHLENAWRSGADRSARNEFEGAVRTITGSLGVVVAIDTPNSIALVDAQRLRRWDRSLEDVLEAALQNLRAISPCLFERTDGGFYVSAYGDYHDASRILLPHIFEQLGLRGDPVAVVLSRAQVVVAGSEDVPALQAMTDFVTKAFAEETRPIALAPIVLRHGTWEPYQTARPELASLDILRIDQQIWDYQTQEAHADTHPTERYGELFLAPLSTTQGEGRSRSYAIWSRAAPVLLPKADALLLGTLDTPELVARSWQDVEAICGLFPVEPGTFPIRYLAEPPSDEVWAALTTKGEHPAWLPAL